MRLQAPGFDLGQSAPLVPAQSKLSLVWYLPLGFGLVSKSSPATPLLQILLKSQVCEPRVQLEGHAPREIIERRLQLPFCKGLQNWMQSEFSAKTATSLDLSTHHNLWRRERRRRIKNSMQRNQHPPLLGEGPLAWSSTVSKLCCFPFMFTSAPICRF